GLLGPGATRVLVLTTFDLDEYLDPALRAGASGFLVKTVGHEQLLGGVRAVAAGQRVLAPSTTTRLVDRYLRTDGTVPDPSATRQVAGLTDRERTILALVARGLTNTDIARHLVISEHTVKTHLGAILHKTASRDRSQAIVLAYDAGLVRPGEFDREHRRR
ncbi:MAG: LuxR C-terminal-related transcriptional regulator, partial [Phycicoccus sp.]